MKNFILLGMGLLMPIFGWSQSIKGHIVDSTQSPIESVYVLHMRTGDHIHSDGNGFFQMKNTKVGDTLRFSHIAFELKDIVISDTQNITQVQLINRRVSLDAVVLSPKLDIMRQLSDYDMRREPVNSSQEILRKVPGLFISQHAGGGKAEQLFLRGFDLDHGTDIAISVDGIPVNMVSHAHGQGYADLHFLIPETVDRVDFGKGTYYADQGNFNTAGYVNFRTLKSLNQSLVKIEVGDFNTQRALMMLDIHNSSKNKAYVAAEHIMTDGPFESPQNFSRTNIFAKFSSQVSSNDRLDVSLSHFRSEWDASGQIPERAVKSGLIGRFGAIDNTEGGETSRSNLGINYLTYLNNDAVLKNVLYYSKYDFELFSNFTFFLVDPENGDQIKQRESRNLYGFNSEYKQQVSNSWWNGDWRFGIALRNDQSNDNELSRTKDRKDILERIQFGDIDETNISAYASLSFEFGKFRVNPALRYDFFRFQYQNRLLASFEKQLATRGILSPKLTIGYTPSNALQLFAKAGKGYHSNDTRVAVEQNGRDILPAAYSVDLGMLWKVNPKLILNVGLWNLYLEQEFVYVGDAGIVEPSGETLRRGVDFGFRYEALSWISINGDVNYTRARALNELEGNDYIPLAPSFTATGGINFGDPSSWYGGINMRHISDRPANEDYTITAQGYSVFDFNMGYKWKNIDFGVSVQNLFDTQWNEAQFATESRLTNETNPVEEIHFTPGNPFFIKTTVSFSF